MRHHALSCFLVYIVCQSAMLLFVCEIHAFLSQLGICPKLVMKDFVLEYCGMKAIESEMQYLLCASYNHGNIKVHGYSCVFVCFFASCRTGNSFGDILYAFWRRKPVKMGS